MTMEQAAAFFVFAVVAAVTPGPSNTMIVATGTAVGVRRGLPCVLGAASGMGSLLFASALGLGQVVIAQPRLLVAMNWCGAALLLWLAWKIATAEHASGKGPAEPVGLIGAALFQWVNPKGWMVAVSAAGTYLQAAPEHELAQAAGFGALFFAAAFPSGLLWLCVGAAMDRLLRDSRKAHIFNLVMAAALVASVVMMLR